MHQSSFDKIMLFRQKYLAGRESENLLIYDLGSQDVNGSYRSLFSESFWHYRGLDMISGKNVDVVLRTPYAWREIDSESADVIVSGQAFEHIQFFWVTMLEISRVLKPGGICCILAPSSGPQHQFPVDCWRFYPDGLKSLARFSRLEVLEATTQWEDLDYVDGSNVWHDSMLVCRKPNIGYYKAFKARIMLWLCHCMLQKWMKECI